MHLLDLIMYFVTVVILYLAIANISKTVSKSSDSYFQIVDDFITGFICLLIILVYTIVYIIIFGVFDNNWIDIIKFIITNISDICKGINFNL